MSLEISYPQYSRYEAGEQLPSLEHALDLGRALAVSSQEVLFEWSLAQVEKPKNREEIDGFLAEVRSADGKGAKAETKARPPVSVPLDDVIVFNRSHLQLFKSDPAYRDIFTYINSFSPDAISVSEVMEAFGLTRERTLEMLDRLSDLGVIVWETAFSTPHFRASKSNFYFPDDADFFELRNQNLALNVQSVLDRISFSDLTGREAFRSVVSRELTESQLRRVVGKLENLVNEVVEIPETETPRRIYSLCLVLGQRFERGTRLEAETGLTDSHG